jgi:DNA polymerase III psi subunit
MQWAQTRTHLEYVSKVLGVQTLLRSTRAPSPAQEGATLQVLVASEDYRSHEELFEKIVAAWSLEPSLINIEQVSSMAGLEPDSFKGTYVLVFTDASSEEFGPRWIFASSLRNLSKSTELKKKLWAQIQHARRDLNGSKVRP